VVRSYQENFRSRLLERSTGCWHHCTIAPPKGMECNVQQSSPPRLECPPGDEYLIWHLDAATLRVFALFAAAAASFGLGTDELPVNPINGGEVTLANKSLSAQESSPKCSSIAARPCKLSTTFFDGASCFWLILVTTVSLLSSLLVGCWLHRVRLSKDFWGCAGAPLACYM
jgi:hypothetical protein